MIRKIETDGIAKEELPSPFFETQRGTAQLLCLGLQNTANTSMTTYEKNVSEPWFSLIKRKIKTVEGRLNKGDFAKMNIGDFIIFTNNESGVEEQFKVKIKTISCYETFEAYLEDKTLENCLPGIPSMEDGLKVYYTYYTKSDEQEFKIKAFEFEF